MTITIQQTAYEPIPTGRYPAKISDIQEEAGQFGPQLKFTFELSPGEDGEKKNLIGWCSAKFNAKCKLYEWTRAALGGDPIDRNYTFSSDDLIGAKVLITVIEDENDKGVFNRIDRVSPYAKNPPAPPPPEPKGDW